MSFKRKVKRAFKRFIGDFTGVQWRDLDHKKVYAAIALLAVVVILVVVLIVMALTGGNDKTSQDEEDAVIQQKQWKIQKNSRRKIHWK